MRRNGKTTVLFLSVVLIVVSTTLLTLRSHGQNKSDKKKASVIVLRKQDQTHIPPTDQEVEGQLPIADAWAPESTDPDARAKRRKKSERYDNQSSESIQETPYASARTWSSHWSRGLSSMPVAQSDAVLIGEVTDRHAYLSNDRTGVYSEFELHVQEVLMNDRNAPISTENITFERFGGAVRFPSGHIQRYISSGQGMPQTGRTYVLFLKRIERDAGFSLLTGFELRGKRVIPIDGTNAGGGERLSFDDHKDADALSFLRTLRDLIAADNSKRERSLQ